MKPVTTDWKIIGFYLFFCFQQEPVTNGMEDSRFILVFFCVTAQVGFMFPTEACDHGLEDPV